MNIGESCLLCLQNKDWIGLNNILSKNSNYIELSGSQAFVIFESYFIAEIKRYEAEGEPDLYLVAARLFQLHQQRNSLLELSENTVIGIANYLFKKHPTVEYAIVLKNNADAQRYLEAFQRENNEIISNTIIGANLDIKVGETGKLQFQKEIFNSPQEKELYLAAIKILPSEIVLPNVALSTIINSKVCKLLDRSIGSFFYKSTLDLCIINNQTYMPEIFIELDSSWHDKPRNALNDAMKNEIFIKAGLKLHRLRKKENKNMVEIFKLFIMKNYSS